MTPGAEKVAAILGARHSKAGAVNLSGVARDACEIIARLTVEKNTKRPGFDRGAMEELVEVKGAKPGYTIWMTRPLKAQYDAAMKAVREGQGA